MGWSEYLGKILPEMTANLLFTPKGWDNLAQGNALGGV
jgi:hypothetical protein